MNGIDVLILGVFFISTLIGAMRGFTKELLSLFSWGGSISLSYLFLPIAQGFVHEYISNPMMAGGVALFCAFILFLVVLSIIANIIAGYIHESSFRGIDHSLGFGFGILRGVFFISAVELGMSTFWPRQIQPPSIQNARFVPMARKGGDMLLQALPNSAGTWILAQAAKMENQVSSKLRERLKSEFSDMGAGSSHGNGHITNHGGETQIVSQGYPQNPSHTIIHSRQGEPVQSEMLIIRPPQPGQAPQLAPASGVYPVAGSAGGVQPSSSPAGLAQSAMPQDKQSTVDALSQLKPRSSLPEDSGYTRSQRDDMNRLFQSADGG